MKNKAQHKFPKYFLFFDFSNTLKINKVWEFWHKNSFKNFVGNAREDENFGS